ncbi:MAG: hypothetical protein V4819_04880, partial [Verrucomicrobiota bacterium]
MRTATRTAFSITDYVFRWIGCQFLRGYRQATAPDHGQEELPMVEIAEMDRNAVNRPVRELTIESDSPSSVVYMGITCSHCGSEKVIRAG